MAISILNNVLSLRVQSDVENTTAELSSSIQRLSSGLRINGPADDPAGLAVAESLRADAIVANVAIRNANDAVSLTTIADSSLEEIGYLLNRMAEVAEQSANGVYTQVQRSALQSEFTALGSEIQRISVTTTFNGSNLLSNSDNVTFQVGIDGTTNSQLTLEATLGTLESLGLASTGLSALTYSITGNTSTLAQAAALTALSAVDSAIDTLSQRRGKLGGFESRLSYAIEYITVARDNFVAAESRIRDLDVASEVANMISLQVRQQAATAILAQANQAPATAVALLRDSLG